MQDFISHKDQTHSKSVTDGWTPDIPSLFIGALIGALGVLIGMEYLDSRSSQIEFVEAPALVEEAEAPFVFEFYDELKGYEVLPSY
jgi:hypothetical protein